MATVEEQIRLLIADGGDTPHYTSGQIAVFVTLAAPLGGSVYIAAALALEAWAADLTDNVESESIGDYCLPTHTEALSRSGWVKPKEIQIGEEILTYDPKYDRLKWAKVLDVHISKYEGKMLSMTSGTKHVVASILASPNHRWYVKPLHQPSASWSMRVHTSKQLNTWDRIPLAAEFDDNGIGQTWSNDLVECVGWFVTEGNFQHSGHGTQYAAFINQSRLANPRNCERIRTCLHNILGISPAEHDHGNGNIGFYIGAETYLYKALCQICPEKQLTMDFINELTLPQMQLLRETMIKGDGDKERLRFYQKKNRTLETFQALSVLCGFGTYLTKKTKELADDDAIFSLSNLTKINRGVVEFRRGWVDFTGDIWCPNTETGTWLVRDKGFTYITGNSYSKKQADKKLTLATRYRDQASALDDAPACGWASMDLASIGEDTV